MKVTVASILSVAGMSMTMAAPLNSVPAQKSYFTEQYVDAMHQGYARVESELPVLECIEGDHADLWKMSSVLKNAMFYLFNPMINRILKDDQTSDVMYAMLGAGMVWENEIALQTKSANS